VSVLACRLSVAELASSVKDFHWLYVEAAVNLFVVTNDALFYLFILYSYSTFYQLIVALLP